MGQVCKGGFLDGMSVYTKEDRDQCSNGGGQIVDTGGSTGCAASSIAAMPASGKSDQHVGNGLGEDVLQPFRRMRKLMGNHPLVKQLIALNSEAADEIERVALTHGHFREEVVSTVALLSRFAEAVTSRNGETEVYTAELHQRVRDVAQKLHDYTERSSLKEAIERVLSSADSFVGKTATDIAIVLKGNGDGPIPRPPATEDGPITATFPSAAVVAATQHSAFAVPFNDARLAVAGVSLTDLFAFREAERAIEAKARSLGELPGPPQGDTVSVPGGYMRSYRGCDIYYSKSDGAHEVHGDIRAKYNVLGGAGGVLGLPVTDETGTPDGIGRFNHFKKGGSIYWTPNTGPMMVRSVIRDLWASQGWENGPMGYPVADEYRLPPLFYPRDNPDVAWSLFQNGALFSKGNAVAPAIAANLSPGALKGLIRTFFDRGLKRESEDLGLEAQVDLLSVSGWSYGFWRSLPRTVTYRLHGFNDNGWLPDTTFEIEIRLRFALASSMSFTYPSHMSLTAALDWLRVSASGLGSGQASNGIFNGVYKTFYRGGPDPNHPEVPNGAIFITSFPTGVNQTGTGNIDVIDVLTTAQGGLQVLLNPLPPSIGTLRRNLAQNQIDAFLESF